MHKKLGKELHYQLLIVFIEKKKKTMKVNINKYTFQRKNIIKPMQGSSVKIGCGVLIF